MFTNYGSAGGGAGGGGGGARGGSVDPSAAESSPESAFKPVGSFWKGQDGNVWVAGADGTNSAGKWDSNTTEYWQSRGYKPIFDPQGYGGSGLQPSGDLGLGGGGGGGGGGGAEEKTLDTDQLASLDSLIKSLGTMKQQGLDKAGLNRKAAETTKEEEKEREEGKYKGKKLGTLQDFAGAKTDTDLNTRNTLENLMSSLSTLGLGGSRALTRQILDAANMSNRKANATQATDNMNLDSAFNEYEAGYGDDMNKIQDQYGYESGEANRKYLEAKQRAMYKKADVYNATDRHDGERQRYMRDADGLNSMIAGSSFMNPKYSGTTRAMDTPELGDYTQDIAKYDTTNVGAGAMGMTPGNAGATNNPGNLAVRAIAVNDKDLGIKKKTESDLGYGV